MKYKHVCVCMYIVWMIDMHNEIQTCVCVHMYCMDD